MPYANNQGIRIHYEVEGDGTPLVLLHGISDTIESWYACGYVGSLKKEYKLILIDVRGHGGSDKPHDSEAYAMRLLVNDVVAALDDLKISKAHFLGYSMGGRIGFGVAKYSPQRFHSLIIGGMHPYAEPNEPWIRWATVFRKAFAGDSSDESAKEALVKGWLGPTAAKMPEWKAYAQRVIPANDWEAIMAFVSKDWGHGFDDVLPTMTMPVLLFDGEADGFYSGVKECVKSIPNATFISFPKFDHADILVRMDIVLPHITKFLKKVSES